MNPVAQSHSNTAVTYFGVRDINNRDDAPCILCQQPIYPFKWMKRVERYDPDDRVRGQFTGAPSKTVAEEQRRRYTHFLGWSHGYHKWINPNLSSKWLENRMDVIDVSQAGVDKEFRQVYNTVMQEFAERVKAERHRRGLTQDAFARLWPVNMMTISRWERAAVKPTPLAMDKLQELEQEELLERSRV